MSTDFGRKIADDCEQQVINWPDDRLVQASFATDITRQRKTENTEEELKEALRKYQVFFIHSRDIMVFVDWTSGNILEANPAALAAYGYSHQELLTKNIFDLRVEQEQILTMEQMETAFNGGIAFETMHRRKDGSTFPVEVSSNGEQVGQTKILFSVIRDITERHATQEALLVSNRELAKSELLLRRTVDELAETNKELTSFFNSIAHDFRSPMVNIKGFSYELRATLAEATRTLVKDGGELQGETREKINEVLGKDAPEALGFIYSSVDKLDKMVNALLGLARLGRRDLAAEEVDMAELAEKVLKAHRCEIEGKNIAVTLGDLPKVMINGLAIEQILGNLLDNARKYLRPGVKGQIAITATEIAEEYVVAVTDNGRGVALEDCDKIFQVFRRVGDQDVPGEGLGLAYVRALVRQLGGRVWCESGLGVGTTMRFTMSKSKATTE